MESIISVKVDHASMHFNLAGEKIDSLKEYVLKMVKKQLFFRDFIAVDDVSLTIRKGEVFGIIGTNGSGKSTLLKMISGILKPTTGSITVNGNIAPLIELGAGFDGELSARENIYLNGAVLGYDKKFLESHFDAIVDFAELRDFLDVPIKNYSSGMVARIAFAIATVVEPDILIVDEILSVGDFLFQQKCEQRIKDLMNKGVTIIIVSHSIDQIASLCDRVMWIEKSKVKAVGHTWQVCNLYRGLQNEDAQAEMQQRLRTVAHEKCRACGQESDFQMEPQYTLWREATCNHCGASLRFSDIAGALLKHIGGEYSSIEERLHDLEQLKILCLNENSAIHMILKGSKNYRVYDYFEHTQDPHNGDLADLPFEDDTFDIVLSEEIVKHFTNLEPSFKEIRRVLKPGGAHVFSTPLHEGRNSLDRRGLRDVFLSSRYKMHAVITDFGDDIAKIIDKFDFNTEIIRAHVFHKNEEITWVEDDFDRCMTTHPYMYYKYNSTAFISEKV